jgi:hypothetical protein
MPPAQPGEARQINRLPRRYSATFFGFVAKLAGPIVIHNRMASIDIIIARAGNGRSADVFTAYRGDRLLATSRTPFFDSARRLIELGADPADMLTMRHAGSPTVSLHARVGVAARLTVSEKASGRLEYVPWVDLRSIYRATEVDA